MKGVVIMMTYEAYTELQRMKHMILEQLSHITCESGSVEILLKKEDELRIIVTPTRGNSTMWFVDVIPADCGWQLWALIIAREFHNDLMKNGRLLVSSEFPSADHLGISVRLLY